MTTHQASDPSASTGQKPSAACLLPTCSELIQWRGVGGTEGRPRFFCTDAHRVAYTRARANLGAALEAAEAQLARQDLESADRKDARANKIFLLWHLSRYPEVPSLRIDQ